jgi:opacity protein-like surface antigen
MRTLIFTLLAGLLCASTTARAGDVSFGPRFSVSDDADLGVGADVRWAFLRDDPRLALSASFDYFFPEEDEDIEDIEDALDGFRDLLPPGFVLPRGGFRADREAEYWEANLNLTWDFTAERAVVPYAGLGVNYGQARVSAFGFSSDESDFGANVLAGVRIHRRFYVEAKQEAGGGELFVLTVGVRF